MMTFTLLVAVAILVAVAAVLTEATAKLQCLKL